MRPGGCREAIAGIDRKRAAFIRRDDSVRKLSIKRIRITNLSESICLHPNYCVVHQSYWSAIFDKKKRLRLDINISVTLGKEQDRGSRG